jgi:hypothetical protein
MAGWFMNWKGLESLHWYRLRKITNILSYDSLTVTRSECLQRGFKNICPIWASLWRALKWYMSALFLWSLNADQGAQDIDFMYTHTALCWEPTWPRHTLIAMPGHSLWGFMISYGLQHSVMWVKLCWAISTALAGTSVMVMPLHLQASPACLQVSVLLLWPF